MSDERKLVEFIESYIKVGNSDYQWNDNHGELIRCKDCWKRGSNDCPFIEYSVVVPKDEFFCACGEKNE